MLATERCRRAMPPQTFPRAYAHTLLAAADAYAYDMRYIAMPPPLATMPYFHAPGSRNANGQKCQQFAAIRRAARAIVTKHSTGLPHHQNHMYVTGLNTAAVGAGLSLSARCLPPCFRLSHH